MRKKTLNSIYYNVENFIYSIENAHLILIYLNVVSNSNLFYTFSV